MTHSSLGKHSLNTDCWFVAWHIVLTSTIYLLSISPYHFFLHFRFTTP